LLIHFQAAPQPNFQQSYAFIEELVAPLIVLALADLMLGAQLAGRPILESLEPNQRLLRGLSSAALHGCPPWSKQPRHFPF
jgi:hypothetical protein